MEYFTLYWLDGTQNIIKGNDIESAFNKNWSGGAAKALDFYNNGLVETHKFIPNVGWVEKQPLFIFPSEIGGYDTEREDSPDVTVLTGYLNDYKSIDFRDTTQPDGSFIRMLLENRLHGDIGWVRHITVQIIEVKDGDTSVSREWFADHLNMPKAVSLLKDVYRDFESGNFDSVVGQTICSISNEQLFMV